MYEIIVPRMPISVRALYGKICDCVLEPSALTGETLTDDQFLSALNQVLSQFLELGPYVKPLINQTELGVRIYESSGPTSVIKNLAVDQTGTPMNSGFYWDQSDAQWQNRPTGTPKEWRQDQLDVQGFEVRPAPSWNGYEIETLGSGLYGQISDTSLPISDFDIEVDPLAVGGFLGTISECDYGSVYADCAGGLYGIISNMVVSELNLTEFSIVAPEYTITDLDQYIPDINPSFEPYLRLNLMRIIASNNSETKSVNANKYYAGRTLEGAALVAAINDEKTE